MKRFVDRLEGGYRVARIRRMRRSMYAIVAVITIFLVVAVVVANGGMLKPIFIPMDIVLAVVLVMLIVGFALSFTFRNLRMQYAKRSSHKFLMAKNSIRRGLAIVIFALIIGVLFLLPFFQALTDDAVSGTETLSTSTTDLKELNIWNKDTFGMTRVSTVNVSVTAYPVDVCLIEGDFTNASDCTSWTPVAVGGSWSRPLNQDGYRLYSLVLRGQSPAPSTVEVLTDGAVSQTVMSVVPFTMIFIAFMNVVWVAYLFPIRRKFAAASIYSQEYVEEVSGDERVYAEKPAEVEEAPVEEIPEPAVVPEVAAAAEIVTEAEPEEIKPPPPPPEEELPPPPEMVDVPYLFEQAKEMISIGQFEEAMGFYDSILEREPENVGALIGKGTALASLGKADETVECMDTVLEIDPKNRAAILWMAKIFETKDNWHEALKWYDRYLGIYPGHEEQWIKHGDVLVQLGRGDIAIESYRNALKINPRNQEATRKLEKVKVSEKELMSQALSRSALGDYVGAVEIFDRVLRIDPGNTRALLGKGVAYRRLNKITSAIECLNRVLELDPDNQAALLNKGGLLEGQEKWEEALYCYNELIEANPKDEEAWVKKGDVHVNLDMKEEALESYREALEINPDNYDVAQRSAALEGEFGEVLADKEAIESLMEIKGVTKKRATLLYEAGFRTVDDIAQASTNKLKAIKGISRKTARMILDSVKKEEEEFATRLTEVPGVGPSLAKAIKEAGFETVEQIKSASVKELAKIKGISKKKAENIIDFLNQ